MGGDCTCIEATLLGICSVAKRFPMALYVAGDISRDGTHTWTGFLDFCRFFDPSQEFDFPEIRSRVCNLVHMH